MEGREAEEERSIEVMINSGGLYAVSDREEEDEDSDGSLFSIDFEREEKIYVGIGKCDSSMDALAWALDYASTRPRSTVVYLVHVFPAIRRIPSPLGGMLPISQANPEVVESYLDKQNDERNKLLKTYIDSCSALAPEVRVQTVLVENDIAAKAILELILKLNIKKLILGSTKSTLHKSKKGVANQILRKAPQTCEIGIICKGKRVNDMPSWSMSPSPRGSSANSISTQEDEDQEPSPEMNRSKSDSSIGKPLAVNVWNVFNWVL